MIKKVIGFLPELITTSFAMLWFLENYIETGSINYYALVAGLLLMIAAVTQSRPLGMAMGIITILFSVFMGIRGYLFLVELQDKALGNRLFYLMLAVFLLSLVSGIALFFKYYRKPVHPV